MKRNKRRAKTTWLVWLVTAVAAALAVTAILMFINRGLRPSGEAAPPAAPDANSTNATPTHAPEAPPLPQLPPPAATPPAGPPPAPGTVSTWTVVDDNAPDSWDLCDDLARWVLQNYEPAALLIAGASTGRGELRVSLQSLLDRYELDQGKSAGGAGSVAGAVVSSASLQLVYYVYADRLAATLARQAETTQRVALTDKGDLARYRMGPAEIQDMFQQTAAWLRSLSTCRLALLEGAAGSATPGPECPRALAFMERLLQGKPDKHETMLTAGRLLAGLADHFDAQARQYEGRAPAKTGAAADENPKERTLAE